MSFLGQLKAASAPRRFEDLGYVANPFPVAGQVWPSVYVERQELNAVQVSLLGFLRGESAGRMWALAGQPGFGKSNFLRHVEHELQGLVSSGSLEKVAYRYIPSQQVSPRFLAQEVVQAVGEDALVALFERLQRPPTAVEGTDLGRFLVKVIGSVGETAREHARFVARWLGGHQTYADERRSYGINAKQRLAPAVGVAYLRVLMDLLAEQRIVDKLVLLLDEFEDVQALRKDIQSEYLMALKGLVNAFNWERLFVVVAGQEAAFTTLGARIPSLQSRWTQVRLQPLKTTDEAIALASAYKTRAHERFREANHSRFLASELQPSDNDVKVLFAEQLAGKRRVEVTPRELLHSLYEWVEQQVS